MRDVFRRRGAASGSEDQFRAGISSTCGIRFGGSAEYVALQFKAWHVEDYFYWYVTVMCLISFIVAIRMPDPSRSGLLK